MKKANRKNRKGQVKIAGIKLEQSHRVEISSNSGVFLLAELLRRIKILERLRGLGIFNRQKIGEASHILSLVLNQFTGGEVLRDTEHLKGEKGLQELFEDLRIPAPHTSGDFLERFDGEVIERFRQLLWKAQEKFLKKLAKRQHRRLLLSIDSSVYEVYGNCKESSSMSYKGIFGYHPILLHIHDTGELLDIILRGGNSYTAAGVKDLLERNIERLKEHFKEIILLGDAGFFDKSVVETCEAQGIYFIITSELPQYLRNRLEEAELVWSGPARPGEEAEKASVKRRDSHSFNYRLANLRELLAKKGRRLKVRGELELTDFMHTVKSWDTEYRFVFKRQLMIDEAAGDQQYLFEPKEEYFYHGYGTNIYAKSREELVSLIDSRGHQENFIKDFKHGLGTVHIPTKHFYGNYAYFLISMLSWNLKYWLLYIIKPEAALYWKRFRYLYIKIGAQIIRSGRYVIIRFGKSFRRLAEFKDYLERLRLAEV